MIEKNDSGFSPMNNSPDASEARFKARQNYMNSTEGQVASAARNAERQNQIDKQKQEELKKAAPDQVTKKRIFGIPFQSIFTWFKK